MTVRLYRKWHPSEIDIITRSAGKVPFESICNRLDKLARSNGWTPRTRNAIYCFIYSSRLKKAQDSFIPLSLDTDGSFYCINQIAQALGLSPHTVAWWPKDKHYSAILQPKKNGNRTLIHVSNLKKFFIECPAIIPSTADIPWVISVLQYESKPSRKKQNAL
jgi:hypothetical protein